MIQGGYLTQSAAFRQTQPTGCACFPTGGAGLRSCVPRFSCYDQIIEILNNG